jgi:hypothetical protein
MSLTKPLPEALTVPGSSLQNPVLSTNDKATLGSQLSVAVGVANSGVAGHSTVPSGGSGAKTGGVLSVTVMVWLAVRVLPQTSVAVQVRVTLYSCGQPPGVVTSANLSLGAGSQASVTVGVAKLGVAGHSTEVGPGSAEIKGGMLSRTRIVWTHWLRLLQSSVATQVRWIT